jgi:hypothetical protein
VAAAARVLASPTPQRREAKESWFLVFSSAGATKSHTLFFLL